MGPTCLGIQRCVSTFQESAKWKGQPNWNCITNDGEEEEDDSGFHGCVKLSGCEGTAAVLPEGVFFDWKVAGRRILWVRRGLPIVEM